MLDAGIPLLLHKKFARCKSYRDKKKLFYVFLSSWTGNQTEQSAKSRPKTYKEMA